MFALCSGRPSLLRACCTSVARFSLILPILGSLEMVRHGNGQTSIFETFGNGQTKISLHWKWSDKKYSPLEMVRQKLFFTGNGQTKAIPLWKWSDTHKMLHWKWSDKIGTQLEMVRQIYLINPTKPTLVNQDYAALTLLPGPPGRPNASARTARAAQATQYTV